MQRGRYIFLISAWMYLEELSWKTEYILEVSYFQNEITCYKLHQHPGSVFSWYLKHQYIWFTSWCFWFRVISTKWRNKLLIHNINLTGNKNMHVAYCFWFSWRHESSLGFGIGDPRFFLRVAPIMTSKRFVKLSTIEYYIIW